MNWKLIFQLSLFGLLMAILTISIIPANIEPFFWLVIFVFCAVIIVKKNQERYFLHGFITSLVNSIWITFTHLLFISEYMTNHPEMVQMNSGMPLANHPKLLMLLTGPVIGAISGLLLGLFALIAGKLLRKGV